MSNMNPLIKGIVTCPNCKIRVVPKMNGTCPNCQANIPEETRKIKVNRHKDSVPTSIGNTPKAVGGNTKKCPYCAEQIQDDAILCRYCGRDIEDGSQNQYIPSQINPEELAILSNHIKGIVDEVGGEELLKLVIERMKSPLDNSLDGVVKALSYYSIVHAKLVKFINITKRLEYLIVNKGRPSVLGRGQWDKEVSSLLNNLDLQTREIFGEEIGLDSINNVPVGCGEVWFYFLALFILAEDIKTNVMSALTGTDPFGIQKAIPIFDFLAEKGKELVKVRDALLMKIKKSGFNLETITKRAIELNKSQQARQDEV